MIFVLCIAENLAYREACCYFEKAPEYTWKKMEYSIDILKKYMRKPSGLKYKKAPILIYGCSYAYGFSLEDEDTFGYKLSEKTKRPVYNFAVSSKGLQDALYLLRNDEKITPEPEYVFYVFINDHVRRMFINCNKIDNVKYLTYKKSDGQLVENTDRFDLAERFYIAGIIKNSFYYAFKKVFDKQIYDLTRLYFISIKNEINNKYPNAKFIVLDYENGVENYLSPQKVKDLEKDGIKVITLNKVFKDKLKSDRYRNSYEKDIYRHPTGEAWDLIIDFLMNEYGI